MFTLGVRAHDVGKFSLPELGAKVKEQGLGAIQLALAKSLPEFAYKPGKLSPGMAVQIRETLAQHGVSVAVLGCYINLIHPDRAARKLELAKFAEQLRFARVLGAPIVGSETGHRSPDGAAVPETQSRAAFRDLVNSVRYLCEQAENWGCIVGIEPVAHKHPLSSIERTSRLLDAVRSDALQIIFDPVNLHPQFETIDQTEFLNSAFQVFGPRIACIHAKDFRMGPDGKVGTLASGTGSMDYPLLMELVQKHKPGIHVLLENTAPDNLAATVAFMQGFQS